MLFAKEPYLLHLLAGSDTMAALDTAKNLLDSDAHDANEREPIDNLSALHVAAAWDNLKMAQLLLHYGAEVDARDIDKRRPEDVASGECKRFLKRLRKKRRREQNKFRRVLACLFKGIRTHPQTTEDNQSLLWSPEELKTPFRKRCPAEVQPKTLIENLQINRRRCMDHSPAIPPSLMPKKIPSAPRRSSSVAREEFLTSDNTGEDEGQLGIPNPNTDNREEKQRQEEEEELRQRFSQLNLEALRERLKHKNCAVGPMDSRNRKIYETKLARLEVEKAKQKISSISRYSPALQKMILNEERGLNVNNQKIGLSEDNQIKNEYLSTNINNKEISFFCYLLIDPTELPADFSDVPFRRFLASVFYVGKGKRSRPLQHLIHASKCRTFAKSNLTERSEKLKRILALWDQGNGVISLHIFYNIHSGEAFVREGAMIDAIGIENLTNLQRGTFPGLASRWTRQQITEFGSLLLQKGHAIFQNERCRPILEADVAGLSSY